MTEAPREVVLRKQEDALARGMARIRELISRAERCVERSVVPLPPPKTEPR